LPPSLCSELWQNGKRKIKLTFFTLPPEEKSMFCPRCSQEQISLEIKFCPRCGFLLTDVAEALGNNGLVERNVVQTAKDLKMAALKGIGIMFLSAVFIMLSFVFGTPEPSFFVQFNLLVGILLFAFGMGLIGYNFWLKPSALEKRFRPEYPTPEEPGSLGGADAPRRILDEGDPSQFAPYAPPQKGFTTSELSKAPTVTEETTRRLELEKDDL
jgi:hypothetical protein